MRLATTRPLRIFYSSGPGDVIQTYRCWREGRDDPSQVAITYSSQFYDVCAELDAEARVVSCLRDRRELRDGRFHLEHRPIPFEDCGGVRFHLGMLWYSLGLVVSAVRFRADVMVTTRAAYWFVLRLLPLLGVKVVPALHCTLWAKHHQPSLSERLRLALGRSLFSRRALAILAISDDVAGQVRQITRGRHQPIIRFRPTYRRDAFADLPESRWTHRPFRVLYAGRIESFKGVYDLLRAAMALDQLKRTDVVFDLCGEGGELAELRRRAAEAGLADRFICHGACDRQTMKRMFARSHAVIAPTTSQFVEGFNKVVVEGVLAGRPVITSTVCPAVTDVGAAVELVEPDDVDGYTRAIIRLCDERALYESRCRACRLVRENFYDLSQSWGAKLKHILRMIGRAQPQARFERQREPGASPPEIDAPIA